MAEYYKQKLITDLPDQFKGKERIEAFMVAVGRQLDDVKQFYDDLNTKRTLDTAEGAQLDMIGDILGLTRTQAGDLISDWGAVDDDEIYRYVLKYKVLQNSCISTYYDVVKSLQLLWGTSSLAYSEDPEAPARITITLSSDTEILTSSLWGTLMIKPAGVALYFENIHLDSLLLYYGFAIAEVRAMTIGAEDEDVSALSYLCDENEDLLMDELGNIVSDENG